MATGRIGVTPVLGTRWSKAPAGGTTSLSGLDDNSVSLVYSVGYEQVYRNGVLLSRGNDYTATNGTSITLTDATIAGDIIEVFAQELLPLTDAISKGQFTAKGSLLSASAASTPAVLAVGTNGQVLKADSSTTTGLAWGTDTSGALKLISRTSFSNVASQTFDDVFTSTYKAYLVIVESIYAATSSDDFHIQMRYAGPTTQTTTYMSNAIQAKANSATVTNERIDDGTQFQLITEIGSSTQVGRGQIYFSGVGNASEIPIINFNVYGGQGTLVAVGGGNNTTARTYTGFLVKSSSTNITGTISIYGIATS